MRNENLRAISRVAAHADLTALTTLSFGFLFAATLWTASAQQPTTVPAAATPNVVHGIYNWIHSTGDAERAFAFYRDVFGIELSRSPFAGPAPANAAPEQIRPLSDARPDALIWDLTDTKGSRARTVFMHTPNTPFGLELSEFVDIPRSTRQPNPWDPGASTLIFRVRDLDAVVAKLKARGAATVTLGGKPVRTRTGRSMLVRDPDGYLVQVSQASPAEIAAARWPDPVTGTSIGLTVTDPSATLRFYRDLLGFKVRDTGQVTADELKLNGLAAGRITQMVALIPGTAESVLFSVFELPAPAARLRGPQSTTEAPAPANPFHWRIQDVGAPQFQLEVRGLDALIDRTQKAGYRFLSVGAKPIQRPFGRFVFAIDPDGVLVEFVEPDSETPIPKSQ